MDMRLLYSLFRTSVDNSKKPVDGDVVLNFCVLSPSKTRGYKQSAERRILTGRN